MASLKATTSLALNISELNSNSDLILFNISTVSLSKLKVSYINCYFSFFSDSILR